MPSSIVTRTSVIRFLCLGIAGLLALQHCFNTVYLFELTGSLLLVQFGLALGFFIIGALLNDRWTALSSVVAIALSAPQLITSVTSPTMEDAEKHLSLVQANIFHHNPNFEKALVCLMIQETDVITIQELNSEWAPEILKTLKPIYPYFHEEYQDTCCYGIGIYSKHPISNSRSILIEGVFAIEIRLELPHGELTIFSQHTLPPAFPNRTDERNRQLEELSGLIRVTSDPVIALGDFNVVPWDPVMKRFLKTSGQTRIHSGFQATYPMDLGLPLIPIDHVTYSSQLLPTACESFTIPGSDHKGILASFRFKE